MSESLSIVDVLARLEKRIAHLRDREVFHAQQEVHHREERARAAAELEEVSRHFEAFKATSSTVASLVLTPAAPVPDDTNLGPRPKLTLLVQRVIAAKAENERFAATAVAAEVNRRFRDRMKKPLAPRIASAVLRRLRDAGEIREVQEGKPFHEAVYVRR